tara:strand:- start:307 stop:855 length:549 start_codon:yes stop_codon:yes gene_type:complete
MLKLLKNISSNHLVLAISGIVLLYAYYKYSDNKSSFVRDGMKNHQPSLAGSGPCGSNYGEGSNNLSNNSGPAGVSGIQTNGGAGALPSGCARQDTIDPKDLLPKDNNSKFAQMNPRGQGDLMGVSLLEAGHHIGINTVGQSLRNANLQLRSEPANPQLNVGPWHNTTIGPDLNRRPLEIGCQ